MEKPNEAETRLALGLLLLYSGKFRGMISPTAFLIHYLGYTEDAADRVLLEIARLSGGC